MRRFLLVLLCPAILGADDAAKPAPQAAAVRQEAAPQNRKLTAAELRDFYSNPQGRIYSDWADLDTDSKCFRSFTDAGYTTVLSEGMLQDGQSLFRKAYKHLDDFHPGAESIMWQTYTNMTLASFEKRNRDYLKQTYALMRMHRFTDGRGEIRFCAIWLKFVPDAGN
jgi:hypothetical protein